MEIVEIAVPTGITHPLAHCHRHLGNLPGSVFLDSAVAPDPVDAAWSILSFDPVRTISGPINLDTLSADLLDRPVENRDLPFTGGWIGWLDYPSPGSGWPRRTNTPLTGWFGLYDRALLWDGLAQRLIAVASPWSDSPRAAAESLARRCSELLGTPFPPTPAPEIFGTLENFETRQNYTNAVRRVRQWIARGDIYQVNLAQSLRIRTNASPAGIHARLRITNPAPYAAAIHTENGCLLSTSPELFLEIHPDRRIRTRPIKGTRPRHPDPTIDAQVRAELIADPKERAELLMIVDMERNDLGRVCETGSIRVTGLNMVRSYARVHHLTADVTGRLRADTTLADWIRATYPGGSISGAPKARACEIIEAIENRSRGPFCGAIGFFSSNQAVHLNIAIRTGWLQDGYFQFGVGSGIVWDSDPDREYDETLHKASAILAAFDLQPDFS